MCARVNMEKLLFNKCSFFRKKNLTEALGLIKKKDIRRVWKGMKRLRTDLTDLWLRSLATLLDFLISLPLLSFPARTAIYTYLRHWKQMNNGLLGLGEPIV